MVNNLPSASKCDRTAWFVAVTVLLAAAVLANMIFIFCMSSEDSATSGDRSEGVTDVVVNVVYPDLEERPPAEQQSIQQKMHYLVRKLAHFTEFACLGLLSAALVAHLTRRVRLNPLLQGSIPAVFCLLYAASDEIHQIFTNRGPSVKDVLIDFIGALVGIACLRLLLFLGQRVAARRACREEVTA